MTSFILSSPFFVQNNNVLIFVVNNSILNPLFSTLESSLVWYSFPRFSSYYKYSCTSSFSDHNTIQSIFSYSITFIHYFHQNIFGISFYTSFLLASLNILVVFVFQRFFDHLFHHLSSIKVLVVVLLYNYSQHRNNDSSLTKIILKQSFP